MKGTGCAIIGMVEGKYSVAGNLPMVDTFVDQGLEVLSKARKMLIGLTMGGYLKQLNLIKHSFAMKVKDSQMKEDCDDFW